MGANGALPGRHRGLLDDTDRRGPAEGGRGLKSLLSGEHLAALVAIAAFSVGLTLAARLRPGPWIKPFALGLGAFLILAEISWWTYLYVTHAPFSMAYSLPLQLCEIGALVTALALWLRTRLLVELAYFWGMAGALIAVLTPDVAGHWPAFPFVQYFAGHGAAIAASCFLVFGLRLEPRRWAPAWVLLLTGLLALAVYGADVVTGGNYMYLRAKPTSGPTPLDVFGPWPWYLLPGTAVAVLAVLILQLPFWLPAGHTARSGPQINASTAPDREI